MGGRLQPPSQTFMEILKRVKGNSGEVVPFGRESSGFKDEINHRTHKAGYTDRDGQPKIRLAEIMSKPSSAKYRENYDKIKW